MNADKAFLLSKATLHQRGVSGMELSVQISSLVEALIDGIS